MNNQSDSFTLIRNSFKLSEKVENYLKVNYPNYHVFYQSQKDSDVELPWIFAPDCFLPYHGKAGFNLFKISHPEKVSLTTKL